MPDKRQEKRASLAFTKVQPSIQRPLNDSVLASVLPACIALLCGERDKLYGAAQALPLFLLCCDGRKALRPLGRAVLHKAAAASVS